MNSLIVLLLVMLVIVILGFLAIFTEFEKIKDNLNGINSKVVHSNNPIIDILEENERLKKKNIQLERRLLYADEEVDRCTRKLKKIRDEYRIEV